MMKILRSNKKGNESLTITIECYRGMYREMNDYDDDVSPGPTVFGVFDIKLLTEAEDDRRQNKVKEN